MTQTKNEDDAIHVLVQKDDTGWYVRRSKLAMVRFLKAKRPNSTLDLRKKLYAQRNGPTAGDVWQEAVLTVQEIADLPITGDITYSVDAELAPYWPRDSKQRRLLRKGPLWRMIPGQVSQNFNVREFACHDGTGYIEGLMREQGLSKADARARAEQLASYLERIRSVEHRPLRLNSVFRTKTYNARIGGASNSAHTRGFAADSSPPNGVTLDRHRKVVRNVMPSGVGYYPQGHFIHGDLDPILGRRDWVGP